MSWILRPPGSANLANALLNHLLPDPALPRADARVIQALVATDHVVEQLEGSAVRTDDDVLIRLAHPGRDVADAFEAPPQIAAGSQLAPPGSVSAAATADRIVFVWSQGAHDDRVAPEG